MTLATIKKPKKLIADSNTGGAGFGARAILFNDHFHTFEEVARQLMKATRCTYQRGLGLANVVHNTGSAVVYKGHVERCEAVVMVLEEIRLRAKVER